MKLNKIVVFASAACLVAATARGADATTPAAAAGSPPATNAPPVKNPWAVSASAGLTITRGNSRTVLFTGNALGTKKWDKGDSQLDLGLDGVYGENNSVETSEAVHGFGQFNRLFNERLFTYLRLDGLHDGIADVDYRISVSPGMGYYFLKTTNTTLRAEVGPGYIYEEDGDNTSRSYMTFRMAERFEQKISPTAKCWESVEYLPQVDRYSNYIINFEAGVETSMNKRLSLQTYLQDAYHSEPTAHREKNDLKLVAGVKYKF